MRGLAMRACIVGAIVTAAATATWPAAAISFRPPHRASAPDAWNPGKSLVATPTRLLSIWASDCPPPSGRCATDDGPRMGVFVRRSPSSKAVPDWSTPKRLSPPTIQAERPSIASEGSAVIASYVKQRSYLRYRPRDPRVLWVRVSTDQGKSWRSPVRLTSGSGRVDYPRVAIGNGRLFVVWTGAGGGDIRLATSDDLGHHWSTSTVGTTRSKPLGPAEGFAGYPDVGASGDDVAIAWIANGEGKQVAITSATGGNDLSTATPTELASHSPDRGQQYPAVGGADDPSDPRVAIAFTKASGVSVAIFDGSSLSAPSVAISWPKTVAGAHYQAGYGPAVVPFGATRIALAVAGCRRNPQAFDPCNPRASGARIDVLYRMSNDDGATWDAPRRLTNASQEPYRVNDEPSIALTGPTHRVSFDRYERSFRRYDVWLRSST